MLLLSQKMKERYDAEKTAVLVHGYGVHMPDWEWIVWGKPQDRVLGRASRGLELACANDADLLYVGGGGSSKDGELEGQIIYEHMLNHANELHTFNICERGDAMRILTKNTHVDTHSKNTFDETMNFMRLCDARGIENLTLVSSPFQGPRCQKIGDTLRILYQNVALRVATITADTDPKGERVSHVVIVEPRHPINPHVRRMLDIPKEKMSGFGAELDSLLARYA